MPFSFHYLIIDDNKKKWRRRWRHYTAAVTLSSPPFLINSLIYYTDVLALPVSFPYSDLASI